MSSRRQMGKSFGSGSEGSDSDDAPEEVSTSSWGKESEMARRERERLVKTRARDAAALKRKQMADRIRKQQEEAKAMRALAETVAKAKEGGDEGEGASDEDDEGEGNGLETEQVDYSKPQVRQGYHLHLLTKDDDKSLGHKTIDKSVTSFAERALYGRNSGKRVSTRKALSMKRKGGGASMGFATTKGKVKRLREVGGKK